MNTSKELLEIYDLSGISRSTPDPIRIIARRLMDLAGKQSSDEAANKLSRIGETLVYYGEPFGPKNLIEVSNRTGETVKCIKQSITYSQKSKE